VELAEKSLRASAGAARDATFDVFLSHCIRDAQAIEGVRHILLRSGLTVYVDWLEDPEMDRSRVTVATAQNLRMRMRNSRALIFATSEASPTSKWMPWELGYFDGLRPDRVAVLPLVESADRQFYGQEYLRLYPKMEDIGFGLPKLGFKLGDGRQFDVPAFLRQGVRLR
jgi:hypothetical protein